VKRRKGILIGDYIIKYHAPELLVRNQLDRGELPYTWVDEVGTERASADGGKLPPKDWWRRPEFTWIDCERHSVRGHALFGPVFPMYSVRVYPAIASADTPNPKGRLATKYDLVLDIMAEIEIEPGLQPAAVRKKVLPVFRRRWAKLNPDDDTKPSVSPRTIIRAYREYLSK
jgi:hypothetical protein